MRHDATRTNTNTPHKQTELTVTEAAAALSISAEAVRARIYRGTLPNKKEGGKVYVLLESHEDNHNGRHDYATNHHDTATTAGQAEMIQELRNQIEFLKEELSTRNEESRRKDHIIAALTERIPELEAPPQPEKTQKRETASAGPEQEPQPWWKRIFAS